LVYKKRKKIDRFYLLVLGHKVTNQLNTLTHRQKPNHIILETKKKKSAFEASHTAGGWKGYYKQRNI